MTGQEYLEFQLKKFNRESSRRIVKAGILIAASVALLYGPPLLYLAGPLIFAIASLSSSLIIVFGLWMLTTIERDNAIEFLRQIAHEEAERIRSS